QRPFVPNRGARVRRARIAPRPGLAAHARPAKPARTPPTRHREPPKAPRYRPRCSSRTLLRQGRFVSPRAAGVELDARPDAADGARQERTEWIDELDEADRLFGAFVYKLNRSREG